MREAATPARMARAGAGASPTTSAAVRVGVTASRAKHRETDVVLRAAPTGLQPMPAAAREGAARSCATHAVVATAHAAARVVATAARAARAGM